ncbi:MAG: hypothetical protein Q8Q14_10780 [Gemmatimonadales bacterium]|nr:hypothetical protein [Gemmatimonadales bacterium]
MSFAGAHELGVGTPPPPPVGAHTGHTDPCPDCSARYSEQHWCREHAPWLLPGGDLLADVVREWKEKFAGTKQWSEILILRNDLRRQIGYHPIIEPLP